MSLKSTTDRAKVSLETVHVYGGQATYMWRFTFWRVVTHAVGFMKLIGVVGPPLWSSGQSSWLLTHRSLVRFPALPNFLPSNGSGTGSVQSCEDK
jgi:hypothetical protein